MTIENYIADLDTVAEKYHTYWKLPVAGAYNDAHTNYQEVLNDQSAKDKLKGELIALTMSIGVGGMMTGMLGTAVMRTVTLESALSVVCNRNMNRTFNAMALVSANPAAHFMTKAAWDGLGDILKANTKQQIQALASQAPFRHGHSESTKNLIQS